jgi:anti-sigma regulatory factor (Ser/Thr protein kinase)
MPEFRLSLPPQPESVKRARDRLRVLLDSWGDEQTRHAALVLLSELVTNAVRHAPGLLHVTVTLAKHRLHARVRDESPEPPNSRRPDEHGGRGLELLQVLSKRWGVEDHPGDGKTVWFELVDEDESSPGTEQGQTGLHPERHHP